MDKSTRRFGRFALQLDDPELARAYLESPRCPWLFDLLIDGEVITDDGIVHGHGGCECCEDVAASAGGAR